MHRYILSLKGDRYNLCRIIDLLHMGYVDEVLFGKEVVGRVACLSRPEAGAGMYQSFTRIEIAALVSRGDVPLVPDVGSIPPIDR